MDLFIPRLQMDLFFPAGRSYFFPAGRSYFFPPVASFRLRGLKNENWPAVSRFWGGIANFLTLSQDLFFPRLHKWIFPRLQSGRSYYPLTTSDGK